MLIPVVLALFTAATPPQDSARGVIRGTVQSEPTGLPVPLAVVEAEDGRQTVHAIADSTGAYRLRVNAGTQTLRVRHLEHAPVEMEVLVPGAGELVLDVVLSHRPIALAPVRVRPPVDPRADSTVVERPVLGALLGRSLESFGPASALTDGFLHDASDPASVNGDALYVRGSAANLQLVLLDGAPVYAPFHIGGLIETFEPEVMGNARMYLGGAPARYDGGLSYVMDLSTRSGREQPSASGSADMVAATGRVEGPLGGARYLGSVRTVHGATLSPLEGRPFPYDFADGLVRVDVPLPEGGISTTLFANAEAVRVDTLASGKDRQAEWGNVAASVRYRGRFEGADVEMTLAAGRYDADLPLRYRGRMFQLVGRSDRIRAGVDFLRDERPVVLRYGASFERTWVQYRAYEPEPVKKLLYNESSGVTAGGYMDASWQPAPRVVLRGGLRGDAFSVGGVATLAPRASATWLVSEGAALTLAGGRYHQYIRVPRRLVRGATLGNFADSTRIPTIMTVAGATHLSVGLDQQMGGGVRLGLEGFYKRFLGLPSPQATDTMSSTAHNSGVDVWVRRTAGGLTGWFGYSLNWAWSTRDRTLRNANPNDTTRVASDEFTGRHTLSAGVRGVVWRRTNIGVRLAYGSRLPESAVNRNLPDGVLDGGSLPTPGEASGVDLDTEAPLNAEPDGFIRLDAEISRTWTPTVGGRTTQVTPYLRVINDLNHRDGLFYRYLGEDEDGDLPGLGTFPLVPVFGVSWKI
jgi:hypothetical protein